MKFVDQHFTKHHLLHSPHKWFLAFLVSPLHFAEQHYKNKYHLNFRHAKKLFVFDMTLLLSVFVIAGASLFWWLYDPTVLDLVSLQITPSQEKIKSGEVISYTFSYENKSDVTLLSPILSIGLPSGFIIDKAEPAELFQKESTSFSLPAISSGGEGQVRIEGKFYDTPNVENEIEARLSYRQIDREKHEVKVRKSLTILRGSVLETTLALPDTILSEGTHRFEVTLHNAGQDTIEKVRFPLTPGSYFSFGNLTPTRGTIEQNVWEVQNLQGDERVNLVANLVSKLPQNSREIELRFAPVISVNTNEFPQVETKKILKIVHPKTVVTGSWAENKKTSSPGKLLPLTLSLKNEGDTVLNDITLSIPFPNQIVDIASILKNNVGKLTGNTLIIQKNVAANLRSLAPGETTSITIKVPLRANPSGTDIVLGLSPELSAHILGIDGSLYKTTGKTETLSIGTTVFLNSESRYYTDEGDQLGRGPLPPRVGKETKYWAIISFVNGSSRLRDVSLTAHLPAEVTWTGRTSVSTGKDFVFDENTRTLRWTLPTIEARGSVGLHAELSVTPTDQNQGQILPLLENLRLGAHDTFIDTPLSFSAKNIDTSLPNDQLGQEKGTKVE